MGLEIDLKKYPNCFRGHTYALEVVSGEIINSKYIIGACERYLKDLEEGKWPFDLEKAERFLRVSQRFSHIKGEWKTKNIHFEDWQCFIFMNIFGFRNPSTGYRRFRTAHIEVSRGSGKANTLDTLVPTPYGIKKWGDIDVGSELYGRDGRICKVVGKTPTTMQRVYEVVFSDGTVVKCSGEHEWITSTKLERGRKSRHAIRGTKRSDVSANFSYESIRNTVDIKTTLKDGRESNHLISNCSPTEGVTESLGIDPYFLGYWIGNGTRGGASIDCHIDDSDEILGLFRARGILAEKTPYQKPGNGCRIGVKLESAKLKKLGILDKKNFMSEWLGLEYGKRIELLRGFLDSDGTIDGSGWIEFYSSDPEIAIGVKSLCCSFGFKVTISEKKLSETNNFKTSKQHYRVSFTARGSQRLFNLKRKYRRQVPKRGNHTYSTGRYIIDVIETDKYEQMFCVQVDSIDNTYLISESYIPTHNSLLASVTALYMLALDNPKGNEISTFATKNDQARIVLDSSRAMAKGNASYLNATGVKVLAHTIKHERSNSIMRARSADHGSLDGLNDILSIIDELHAVSRELYDVVVSGMNKRTDSLLLCITTAGFNTDGVGHDQSVYAKRVATGEIIDEYLFSAVYTVDEGDDIFEEDSWKKANPNYGVSVDVETFKKIAKKSREIPADLPNFKVKHLNMWLSEAKAFFDMAKWDLCKDENIKLEQFKGHSCVAAIDMASKIDLTSIVLIFKKDGLFYIFDKSYIPEDAAKAARSTLYDNCIGDGYLIATKGDTIQYDRIKEDTIQLSKNHKITDLNFDPWNVIQLAQDLKRERINCVEFGMKTANLSEPTKALDVLIREKKIRHNGSPLMRWCFSNIVVKYDAAENVFPKKSHDRLKIDVAIAAIMAIATHIQNDKKASVYQDRGLRVL